MHLQMGAITMLKVTDMFQLLLCLCFLFSATGQNNLHAAEDLHSEVSSNLSSASLNISTNNLERNIVNLDQETFSSFSIPGEGITYEAGKPMLPMVSRYIVVPPDCGLELAISSDEPEIIMAEHNPAICVDEGVENLQISREVKHNRLYPSSIAEMSEPMVIRGIRIVKVTTFPVQYDGDNGLYLHHKHINAEIQFTNDAAINTVQSTFRTNRSREFSKFINALVDNPTALNRDNNEENLSPYVGHYLIVANENCILPARDFIEWRRKSGYKVEILSIENNQQSPSTVKRAIRDLYNDYLDRGIDPFDHILLIGDREQHQDPTPRPQWKLTSERGETLWNGANHADYKYGLLEGNDMIMDVAVSRWSAGRNELMALNIGRTLGYEAYPDMEDPSWFERVGVGSTHWGNTPTSAWHVSINSNMRWTEEVMKHAGYDEVRFYEDYDYDQRARRYGPWERDLYNDKSNIIVSRAECYNWINNFSGVSSNNVFPIRLNVSGHGEWANDNITRTGNVNNLKGPVAATCGWGGPPTAPMNAILMNMVRGMMSHDLSLGWSRVFTLTNFQKIFPNFGFQGQSIYGVVSTDYDVYGDPGVQPWLGVPIQLEISHPQAISPRTRMIEVSVFNPDNGESVSNARVSIYAPGDIPDDLEQYIEHEVFMKTTLSDENGIARFMLEDNNEFDSGTMYVTLTGREILPVFGEIEIVEPDAGLELRGYVLQETSGNEDEIVNPGETFNFHFQVNNPSEDSVVENVVANVSSDSPYLIVSNSELEIGSIAPGETVVSEIPVELQIDQSCPDGMAHPSSRPNLIIEFSDGENTWRSGISLDTYSPAFRIHDLEDGNIIPVDIRELNIEIENMGRQHSSPLTAELIYNGMSIALINSRAQYPHINVGNHAEIIGGNPFTVCSAALSIPGSIENLGLVLTNESGFSDTVDVIVQVREPHAGDPHPKDKYGYTCFDNTDSDWAVAPEYDWIEICLDDDDRDFDGVRIDDFTGQSEHSVGESSVIQLPFETQFYGETYDKITVCTNGYICMGDQGRITNFQNWPMDQAIGAGMGVIAPFWDWLKFGNRGGVYYYHDVSTSRFIIEWFNLRHRPSGGDELTFQIIIHDRSVWGTATGDQNILFQYKRISQNRGPRTGTEWENNISYASVGISSPDGTTGLNYTFNNEYPVSSAEIVNRRALIFATSANYKSCILKGSINDFATGAPIPGALITTSHGFTGASDENGYWRIDRSLAELQFSITVNALGYNDSTLVELFVNEDDSLDISFNLLHPEIEASTMELSASLEQDNQTELNFHISNPGNGILEWTFESMLPNGADADPWDYRQAHAVGEMVDDGQIKAVVFVDSLFYVAGSNNRTPTIYIFNKAGALVDTFAQPGDDIRGIKDLAYDGELIWGAVNSTVYGFTTSGEIVSSFEGPYSPVSAITWDSQLECLWLGAVTANPVAYTRDGNLIEMSEIDRQGLRIYGLSYWPEDADNSPLYIFYKENDTNRQAVQKANTETGELTFVNYLDPENGGSPAGSYITNAFDAYSWIYICISSTNSGNGGDRIDMWQLQSRTEWYDVETNVNDQREPAKSGIILPGDQTEFILSLNSTGLPCVPYDVELHFYHNSTGGHTQLNARLDVLDAVSPRPFDLISPFDGDTLESTEVAFEWEQSIDPNPGDVVSYIAWIKVGTDSVSVFSPETTLNVDLDTLMLDMDSFRENGAHWWVEAISGEETTVSVHKYHFKYKNPVWVEDESTNIPVEFSISSIYPNPFNATTTVLFGIEASKETTLRVYDVNGRETATLFNGVPEVGWHSVTWNGGAVPSGIYFLKLESAGKIIIARTALLK